MGGCVNQDNEKRVPCWCSFFCVRRPGRKKEALSDKTGFLALRVSNLLIMMQFTFGHDAARQITSVKSEAAAFMPEPFIVYSMEIFFSTFQFH